MAVLIDEYDKPILDAMRLPEAARADRNRRPRRREPAREAIGRAPGNPVQAPSNRSFAALSFAAR